MLDGPEDLEFLGEGGEKHHCLGVMVPQHRPEGVPSFPGGVLRYYELLDLVVALHP